MLIEDVRLLLYDTSHKNGCQLNQFKEVALQAMVSCLQACHLYCLGSVEV
jgi:hypothetical protein